MLGASEVDKVYLGTAIVWERGGDIPQEVLEQISYLRSNYFSGYNDDDLYYIYGLYGSSTSKPLMYAVLMIADPNLTGITLDRGGTNQGYLSVRGQAKDNQMYFMFSSPSAGGSDTSFPSGYTFKHSTSSLTSPVSLTSTFRTWTPSGGFGSMNPIVLYGDYPAEKIRYSGSNFDVVYN